MPPLGSALLWRVRVRRGGAPDRRHYREPRRMSDSTNPSSRRCLQGKTQMGGQSQKSQSGPGARPPDSKFEPVPVYTITTLMESMARATLDEGFAGRGELILFYGPPKHGKAFLASQFAVSVAVGANWFGRKCAFERFRTARQNATPPLAGEKKSPQPLSGQGYPQDSTPPHRPRPWQADRLQPRDGRLRARMARQRQVAAVVVCCRPEPAARVDEHQMGAQEPRCSIDGGC